ncbi:39S ribosomal protein L42, mitochondrial [Spea bombifrons]|uniref:39S ribosomal protein L42, mitochondrial n=1 Tax=Spea bombifrons TaxID=233779 RepID=UPI00234A7F2D|nr:39S ribosomal protein L42, mitochondrial [Spea bombifrons]
MTTVMMRGLQAVRWSWQGALTAYPRLFGGKLTELAGGNTVQSIRHKTIYSALPDDYNCKVELAMTSDGKTIVCYHPSVDIPYEHTKPIPVQDPINNHEETHEQVLKARLQGTECKPAPTMEELSKMFYTTKHRWYPVGQYHRRRMKKEQLKDR